MKLSTQTHFGQGWATRLLDDARSIGADYVRDSVSWKLVETSRGDYRFDEGRTVWVDKALDAGFDVLLVFHPENPLYDKGFSAYTDKGRAAFADFVVATLQRYPGVTAIEIGNEYNTKNFVSGPIEDAPKDERDDYYAKLIEAVDRAIDSAGIDVTVVGASTHSVPVDYFTALAENGALEHMDGVSIHPYSTDPEQFAAQLEVLRKAIGADTEIHVTEFGADFAELEDAPAFLAKMVAVMAEADVDSANWYAFAKQSWFPNMELWNQKQDIPTPAGVTFGIMQQLLEAGGAVERVEAGSHTYFYTFGEDAAILWGEARSVALADGVLAYDLAGNRIRDFATLSPDEPVILRSSKGAIGDGVSFGVSAIVADSYHDFDLTNDPGTIAGFEGPWSYFAENGKGKEYSLYTMGGGHKAGEPWTPYMGTDFLRPFQIGPTTIAPVDFTPNRTGLSSEYATVERFTADRDGTFVIKGHWDVLDHSDDGVLLEIELNDKVIFRKVIYDKSNGHVFDLELDGIELSAGDTLDFEISSRANARGDATDRRIQILDQDILEGGAGAAEPPAPAPEPPVEQPPADPDPAPAPAPEPEPEAPGDNPYDMGDAEETVLLRGGKSDDVLLGGDGDDKLKGGAGADTIRGGDGGDKLNGGNGDDLLMGEGGDDKLFGEAGDDILDGGAGRDYLAGGAGADIFRFTGQFGLDIVADFEAGDRLDLSRIDGIDSLADLDISYTLNQTVITIGEDSIILKGVTEELSASDFLF